MVIDTSKFFRNDLSIYVWAIYLLQILTLVTGGLSFVVAGIVAYYKYDESIGTVEESHFAWQIKTFWMGLGALALGTLLLLVLIGGFVIALAQLWIAYRVIRGAYNYMENRAMSNSHGIC